MSCDYILKVFNNDELVCCLCAYNTGGYDNVIWYKLDQLIKNMKGKDVNKANILMVAKELYFEEYDLSINNNVTVDVIDFYNKFISTPTNPIYSASEFNQVFKGSCELVKKENKYYTTYEEGEYCELSNVSFDNIELLKKPVLSFKEFDKVQEFYHSIMDEDNEFVLDDNTIIRFNIA